MNDNLIPIGTLNRILQLTLSEVVTSVLLATHRCIQCTLATQLYHHPHFHNLIKTTKVIRVAQTAQIILPRIIVTIQHCQKLLKNQCQI